MLSPSLRGPVIAQVIQRGHIITQHSGTFTCLLLMCVCGCNESLNGFLEALIGLYKDCEYLVFMIPPCTPKKPMDADVTERTVTHL